MRLDGDAVPITEQNKTDFINWIGETLELLDNPNYNNYNRNRVFQTDLDDMDEARRFLSSVFLTLQQSTIIPK